MAMDPWKAHAFFHGSMPGRYELVADLQGMRSCEWNEPTINSYSVSREWLRAHGRFTLFAMGPWLEGMRCSWEQMGPRLNVRIFSELVIDFELIAAGPLGGSHFLPWVRSWHVRACHKFTGHLFLRMDGPMPKCKNIQ
jgi:hypothetical protein